MKYIITQENIMKTRSGLSYTIDDNCTEQEYYTILANRFRSWKNKINQLCMRNFNMGCDDLPDQDYYSSFVEGVTPEQMYAILTREFYNSMMN